MIAAGSDCLVFIKDSTKYKSETVPITKIMWSYGIDSFLILLSDFKLYLWTDSSTYTQLNIHYNVYDFDLTKDNSYIVYTSQDTIMRVFDLKRLKQSSKEYNYSINASLIKMSADDVMICVAYKQSVEILNRTSKEYKKLDFDESIVKLEWSFHSSSIFKLYIMTSASLYCYDCLLHSLQLLYKDFQLIDFCTSSSLNLLYIYGSKLIKYDCKQNKVLESSEQQQVNCLFFDDLECHLYIGYKHGLLKCSVNLKILESISLMNVQHLAITNDASNFLKIEPQLVNSLFTPPRQVVDSVQNLQDVSIQFNTPLAADVDLEQKLNDISQMNEQQPVDSGPAVYNEIMTLREELKVDIANLHVDMIKQMHNQQVILINVEGI